MGDIAQISENKADIKNIIIRQNAQDKRLDSQDATISRMADDIGELKTVTTLGFAEQEKFIKQYEKDKADEKEQSDRRRKTDYDEKKWLKHAFLGVLFGVAGTVLGYIVMRLLLKWLGE